MFFGREMQEVATWATERDVLNALDWLIGHDHCGQVAYFAQQNHKGAPYVIYRVDTASNMKVDSVFDYPVRKGLLFALMQCHRYDTSKHDALACIPYLREVPQERPNDAG